MGGAGQSRVSAAQLTSLAPQAPPGPLTLQVWDGVESSTSSSSPGREPGCCSKLPWVRSRVCPITSSADLSNLSTTEPASQTGGEGCVGIMAQLSCPCSAVAPKSPCSRADSLAKALQNAYTSSILHEKSQCCETLSPK